MAAMLGIIVSAFEAEDKTSISLMINISGEDEMSEIRELQKKSNFGPDRL